MTHPPEVVVHRNPGLLAQAVAARLVTALVDARSSRGEASLVLTGGGIGTAVLAALRDLPAREAVDWPQLSIWWGDERFVPEGDPQRNAEGARAVLLDAVDTDPLRVHPMGAAGQFPDPEAAAAAYRAALAAAAAPEGYGEPVPRFDVLLLGIGPEGHVASVFPESPAAYE
ncbi:MAG: 6-phosphogluconolactonase, partial [Mycobacteriales bacterium]